MVRKEEIEKNSMYFLAGTLINVSYSVLIGFIIKMILPLINC
jgi:tetrahydromethanopterin S-methyltransferase subunit B